MEVFVARGYHAAAMDEIAERAGVSKPVLYQHFPGKQELYLALLDESVERLIEAVAGAMHSTADNRQRVNATFAAYFGYVAEHSGTFKLVFESDFTSEPAVRARLDAADRKCADLISQVIREDAGLADDEAYLLSIGLLGMAQVSARYWLSTLGSIPREAAEQLVARLAWRGISGWPRTSELLSPGDPPTPVPSDVRPGGADGKNRHRISPARPDKSYVFRTDRGVAWK
jgi:AcrR family transcriptional regulator